MLTEFIELSMYVEKLYSSADALATVGQYGF